MSSNKVPIMATISLSCSLDKTQVIFWNNLRNSEIKEKNETVHHSSYLQVFNQAITILARQVLPSGIEPVPAFSLSYVRSQETFVNLCHLTVPNDKRSIFKNFHSGYIFNKILQHTKRSTSQQTPCGKPRSGWPQVAKISTDGKGSNQTSVRLFPLVLSKTRNVCKSCPFSNNY